MSTPVNDPRAQLAAAIAAKAEAERAVSASVDAAAHAQQRQWALQRELRELKESAVDADASRASDYIAAVQEGRDIALLDRPGSDRAQRIEEELEALRETRALLEAETAARRRDAQRAEYCVEQRVEEVVRASDAAAVLLADLEELQTVVAEKRASLRFLLQRRLLPDDLDAQARTALCVDASGADRGHATAVRWQATLDALGRDASAPLPTQRRTEAHEHNSHNDHHDGGPASPHRRRPERGESGHGSEHGPNPIFVSFNGLAGPFGCQEAVQIDRQHGEFGDTLELFPGPGCGFNMPTCDTFSLWATTDRQEIEVTVWS